MTAGRSEKIINVNGTNEANDANKPYDLSFVIFVKFRVIRESL